MEWWPLANPFYDQAEMDGSVFLLTSYPQFLPKTSTILSYHPQIHTHAHTHLHKYTYTRIQKAKGHMLSFLNDCKISPVIEKNNNLCLRWWLFPHLPGFWETIWSFIPCLCFFFFFFFEVDISSCTLILLFMQRSAHSGLASWDDCGRMFPDKLCVGSFPKLSRHRVVGSMD